MVLSKRVARFNRVATNQVLKHIAGWAPGFAIVVHKGRKSGREFRTPINVFRTKDGFVVALTYGPDADWVKNVLAAGRCTLVFRRKKVAVHGAELVHDESRQAMPVPIRQVLGLLDVHDFLLLKRD
ncbi:nitroreductase family deazaflavin-dependent oxidoreductase [Amycolatopsis sp. SID8362]|uniref:nitroreductase family deazaflavin-dependent oxidoreductase n=1 Tax=Amycolatopsis sp. SID8362 TaxID=2690346 RepID=UPI00136B64F8|nr:nitroreductase family deazaflavin-dependent oxidoreductase [Amycolatopsis sp. SID8362]NBH05390.1 nitroreductase family deazaflavin-dependent oxidoreductase [Amycolatopsis sp. SID8362]NED42090.1 nitroreductase family deazaflavin-dependent oxidoreductase [Amycolatopsis sp. SID8362]